MKPRRKRSFIYHLNPEAFHAWQSDLYPNAPRAVSSKEMESGLRTMHEAGFIRQGRPTDKSKKKNTIKLTLAGLLRIDALELRDHPNIQKLPSKQRERLVRAFVMDMLQELRLYHQEKAIALFKSRKDEANLGRKVVTEALLPQVTRKEMLKELRRRWVMARRNELDEKFMATGPPKKGGNPAPFPIGVFHIAERMINDPAYFAILEELSQPIWNETVELQARYGTHVRFFAWLQKHWKASMG